MITSVCRTVLNTAITGLLAIAGSAWAQPPEPLQTEFFARLPASQGLSISPDGSQYAYISHDGDQRYIVITDLNTSESNLIDASDLRAFNTFWADNDTLMARVEWLSDIRYVRGGVDQSTLVTVDVETLEAEQLVRRSMDMGVNFNTGRIAGREAETGHFLMSLFDDERNLNLYAVNPENGRQRLRARGTDDTRYWVADPQGERFVRVNYSVGSNFFRIAIEEDNRWREIHQSRSDMVELTVQGFNEAGDALVISHFGTQSPHTRVLQEMSVADGSWGRVLYQDDTYDFNAVRRDRHEGHVTGVVIEREKPETIWFDPALAQLQEDLSDIFGAVVRIVDWTPDRKHFILSIHVDSAPHFYYYINIETQSAEPIRLSYPELFQQDLPERRPVTFTARDGVNIPAYITLPQTEGPHPFVVLVHGGPASRDHGGFHYMAHFLASRGYGVFQPQFRGSEGFGGDWELAGWGEWGTGLMQHDVNDAVHYLREQGLANQICIAGGSYGGYSALAGAVFTPELYDCAIAYNAVSDPAYQLQYSTDRFGRNSQTAHYWARSFSGEEVERVSRNVLTAISPREHASAISIPVLLMHGEDDTVVPVQQSRTFNRVLSRQGSDVTYIELEGGDHWLLEYETRLEVLERMEAFLNTHLETD